MGGNRGRSLPTSLVKWINYDSSIAQLYPFCVTNPAVWNLIGILEVKLLRFLLQLGDDLGCRWHAFDHKWMPFSYITCTRALNGNYFQVCSSH